MTARRSITSPGRRLRALLIGATLVGSPIAAASAPASAPSTPASTRGSTPASTRGSSEDRCPPLPAPPDERGVALGLFASDPDWVYEGFVDEIAATGATHLSLVWVWWQERIDSVEIAPKPGWSATEDQVLETIAHGRARGLFVTLFPIVRLIRPEPGQWRGKIAPADEGGWWRSYDHFILRAGTLAAHGGAQRLSVGSELLTRERQRARWARLIDRLRLRHPRLQLMYSANWDHYRPVRFWDLVDVVGLTGYWEVGRGLPSGLAPEERVGALVEGWSGPRDELRRLAAVSEKPVVLTEIGYPSLTGGTVFPWDETRKAPVDLEEQRAGYLAAARALGEDADLAGIYWWNWFGAGGPGDRDYTPRGKPAAHILTCWYRAPTTETQGHFPAEDRAKANAVSRPRPIDLDRGGPAKGTSLTPRARH